MNGSEILLDAFGRIGEMVHRTVDGLSDEDLADRVDGRSNSIAWLVWHLTRIQDDHVGAVAGVEQQWISAGWADRFLLPLDRSDIGYGHRSEQVGVVRANGTMLLGYYDAVAQFTLEFLSELGDADFDRVVDTNWDPPVTMGVRLVSVICDNVAHAGQAAYVRGLLERR